MCEEQLDRRRTYWQHYLHYWSVEHWVFRISRVHYCAGMSSGLTGRVDYHAAHSPTYPVMGAST